MALHHYNISPVIVEVTTDQLGQEPMASSFPVVIASDQTPIPISGTITAVVSGGAGTSMIDDAAFTVGTTPVTPSAGIYKIVRDAVDDGDSGAVAMNAKRGQFVTLETSASVEISPLTDTQLRATPVPVSGTVTATTGGLTDAQLRATPVPVSGTVTANVGTGTQPISAASLPLPTGASTSALQTQPGVDIGDVTINNAAAAAAVNIQDGGNSITIDGSLTTVSTVTNLSQQGGVAISLNTGVRDTGTQRVTIATNDVVPASQSGTWTVQPGNIANTTAWKVDGSAVTQPVSGTLAVSSISTSITPGTAATNLGKAEDAAHTSGDVGVMSLAVRNDTYFGSTSLTSADGDYAVFQIDAKGLLKVSNQAYGTLGRPNFYIDVASSGLFEVPTSVLVDPTTGSLAAVTSGALNVVNSSAAANTLFDTKASVAGTALTGSYQTLKVVGGSSVTDIFLLNSCNQTILISMDGGTNDTYELAPYESITMSMAQFHNRYYAGTISVKHNGVVPTAGSIRYAGMKA